MPKNENGCPCMANPPPTVGGVTDNGVTRPQEGCSNGGTVGGVQGGCGSMNGHACGGRGDCLDAYPLAYVYAPDQRFCMLYSAEDALSHGTLFEQLYKPMEVYGRE